MTTIQPTYADPTHGARFTLRVKPIGNTYDPPQGSEFYYCPVCPRDGDVKVFGWGTMAALRKHLGGFHQLRVTDQHVELTLGPIFDEHGQVVRYVDDRR